MTRLWTGRYVLVLEEVKAVEQECEVGRGLGGNPMAFEAHIIAHALARLPSIAKG